MIIDLGNLEDSSFPFEFSLTADELDLSGDNVRLLGNAKAFGKVTGHTAQTDVSGTIRAEAESDCTRCLSPIGKNLEIDFDVAYVKAVNLPEGNSLELEAGDLDTDVLLNDSLDLREVVREQILLNQPDQIFCSEDCKGLCPKCGANRNLINCSCEDKEIDPRWSALKNIK